MGTQRVGHDWSDLAHVQQLHYFCVKMSPSHCINISVVSITDFHKTLETHNEAIKKKKGKPLKVSYMCFMVEMEGVVYTL